MSARRTWTYFFSLWLSLGIVLTHAALPAGGIQAGRGSAFSASTSDVALGPSRRDKDGKSEATERARDNDAVSRSGSGDPPAVALPPAAQAPADSLLPRPIVGGNRARAPPLA